MNLNISGIHLGTGAFIINKIIHLLCPVVFSRQCIDLQIAIQNGIWSSNVRGTRPRFQMGRMCCVMTETDLACWPYYIIQIICQLFIESVVKKSRFFQAGASHTECYLGQATLG